MHYFAWIYLRATYKVSFIHSFSQSVSQSVDRQRKMVSLYVSAMCRWQAGGVVVVVGGWVGGRLSSGIAASADVKIEHVADG